MCRDAAGAARTLCQCLAWMSHLGPRMTKREGYSKRMEHKLAAWKERLDAEKASGTAGAEKLDAWKTAGDKAFAKHAELRAAALRWGEIRDEMEAVWVSIESVMGEIKAAPDAPPRKRASGA